MTNDAINDATPAVPLYAALARLVEQAQRCRQRAAAGEPRVRDDDGVDVTVAHWRDMARSTEARINALCTRAMPHGGGWDAGTVLDFTQSRPDRLVFVGAWHHLDRSGGYSGWTAHNIIVTPSLPSDINVRVTGRDRHDVKAYIAEMFRDALTAPAPRP